MSAKITAFENEESQKTTVKVNHFKDKLCNAFESKVYPVQIKITQITSIGPLLPESLGQKAETTGVIEF